MRIVSLILSLCSFTFLGCGGSGGGNAKPPPPDPAFSKVSSIVEANCGGCHNGKVQRQFNASNFKTSGAAKRIKNGTMPPPPRTLSAPDKESLLSYLEG